MTVPPGEQVLKGIRRRWQQASLARTSAPPAGAEPTEANDSSAHQRQLELEGPEVPAEAWRGTVKAAAAKHSAVKSKAAKPFAVLQSIAESIESTPEHRARSAGRQSMPCGHTGLVSLAGTPVPTGIKEDPRSPDEDTQGANAATQNSPMEIALGEDTDHAGLAEADLTVQSEQRAMQELYRFQKHSMQTVQAERVEEPTARTTPAAPQAAEPGQPPLAPPVIVYH